MQEFKHKPVLLDECLSGLNIRPDGVYVDGTLGGGGHSSEIAKRLTTGTLIGIDRDIEPPRRACAKPPRPARVSRRCTATFMTRRRF